MLPNKNGNKFIGTGGNKAHATHPCKSWLGCDTFSKTRDNACGCQMSQQFVNLAPFQSPTRTYSPSIIFYQHNIILRGHRTIPPKKTIDMGDSPSTNQTHMVKIGFPDFPVIKPAADQSSAGHFSVPIPKAIIAWALAFARLPCCHG